MLEAVCNTYFTISYVEEPIARFTGYPHHIHNTYRKHFSEEKMLSFDPKIKMKTFQFQLGLYMVH